MDQPYMVDTSLSIHWLAFSQVKAGCISEILLNELRKIIYSLYQAKEITEKVCNNIMNSIEI